MSVVRIYLFHIKTQNFKDYYLTSGDDVINYGGNRYIPESGLSLVSGEFNDSAENHIILHGIFEEHGITKNDHFVGASIKIMYLQGEGVKHLVTYMCTQYHINDLDFQIRCESEAIKYNQSLLHMFSKTCRANFGDSKCKININDYAVICNLIACNVNIITCDIKDVEDDYFKGGKLLTDDQQEFIILAHNRNNIEVESASEVDFSMYKQVTLIPACDKNFRTCCYSFNNAVNFRGEPAIPESNIIKN